MSELVTTHDTPPANLPQPSAGEQIERAAAAVFDVQAALYRLRTRHQEADAIRGAIARTERMLADNGGVDGLARQFAARRKPASREDIAKGLAILIGARANVSRLDARAFMPIACEDIGAAAPSMGGLDDAIRKLRRTSKFMPEIPEILEALAEAESRLRYAEDAVRRLPSMLEDARESLRRAGEIEVRQREGQRREIARRLADGKDVDWFEAGLVAQVRAEVKAEGDA